MEAGKTRSFPFPPVGRWLPFLIVMQAGCTLPFAQLDRALLAHPKTVERMQNTATVYTVAFPDVLAVQISGRPELSGRRRIGADGRINLGACGRLRVEGLPLEEIVPLLAQATEIPPSKIRVQILDYNSRHIYLSGQVKGLQRAVAYRGPETVLDLLQRAGGVTAGAAPREVYVVRAHIGENRQPEVFHVDLRAIVMKRDARTNIYVRPYDEVFVGETLHSSFERCIPPWMRPLYESFWGMRRPEEKSG
jgi:protein involved in polysaccharide export with SLBB domain